MVRVGLSVAIMVVIAGCGGSATSSTTEATELLSTSAPTTVTTAQSAPPPVGVMPRGEKVPGMSLWSMVDGNNLSADRINLVFAPWGWDSQSDFVDVASGALSWSGDPYLIDVAGGITRDPSEAVGAQLGVFAIEPWRSNRHRFNVWFTDLSPDHPTQWLNTTDYPFSDVPDVSIITLALDADLVNPDLTSVAGLDTIFTGPGLPTRPSTNDPFANAVAVISSGDELNGLSDIPHEFGHTLFNLPDEYVGQRHGSDGRTDTSAWPSCANDVSQAARWWGDLLGQIDPMMAIWAEEMHAAGFPIDEGYYNDQVMTSNVEGGCYAVPNSMRATQDSLMNTNIPVLGSVNRRWAQQVLNLWQGAPRT